MFFKKKKLFENRVSDDNNSSSLNQGEHHCEPTLDFPLEFIRREDSELNGSFHLSKFKIIKEKR